jgi:excisionase family DNA binding protein
MTEMLTVVEFARRTGRAVQAVYKLLQERKIDDATQVLGRYWQIPESQVARWAKKSKDTA